MILHAENDKQKRPSQCIYAPEWSVKIVCISVKVQFYPIQDIVITGIKQV